MRALAWIPLAVPLAACGVGADVRFVVETAGEARVQDLELSVGDETRFFGAVEHGHEVVEQGVPEGTRVRLRARNGGDEGEVLLRGFLDDCQVAAQQCDGPGCVTLVEFSVREGC